MPWLVLDPKEDDLLGELGAHEIDFRKKLPTKPGLYICHPIPESDDEYISARLTDAIENRRTGIYVDEAYSLPKNPRAFRRILTQGRSRLVPTITLSQRPVWIDRFNYSEASFIQQFRLTDKYDRRGVRGFVGFDPDELLPEYHSQWFDVANNQSFKLAPVPSKDEVISTIRKRLGNLKKRKWF